MIAVTALSTFLYCPRMLYLQKVIKIRPPPKAALIKGKIKHSVIDKINKKEQEIVCSINSPNKIYDLYLKHYQQIFTDIIKENIGTLDVFKIDPKIFYQDTFPIYEQEAKTRSIILSNFIQKNKIFGQELWENLEPKFITELSLNSENLKLRGIIDKIEVYKDSHVPIEMKSGKLPQTGVWPSNKIQLTAYLLMLKEKFQNITHGFIHYLDHNEKRRVTLNPFSIQTLIETRDKCFKTLDAKQPPEILNNNKCTNCDFKGHCNTLKSS